MRMTSGMVDLRSMPAQKISGTAEESSATLTSLSSRTACQAS